MRVLSISYRRSRPDRWSWPAAAVLAFLSSSAAMGLTVLNFEDLPAGTTVTAQYAPQGVLFLQAYLDTDPAAHSATHVLRVTSPSAEIFTPVPFEMDFTSPQARVKLVCRLPGNSLERNPDRL